MRRVNLDFLRMFAVAVCATAVMALSGCSKEPERILKPADIYQEVKSVDKLVLASMAITKTATLEDPSDLLHFKWGSRIAVYSYDTYMRAYVDLSELKADDLQIDEERKYAKLTLPKVRIEVTGRDMELRNEYSHISGLRSRLDSKERAELKEKANADFKKEIAENSEFGKQLESAAHRKARVYFESLLEANGYEADVEFK